MLASLYCRWWQQTIHSGVLHDLLLVVLPTQLDFLCGCITLTMFPLSMSSRIISSISIPVLCMPVRFRHSRSFVQYWVCFFSTGHGGELSFIFHSAPQMGFNFTADEEKLSNQMITYWTNFAKYGDPNGKGDLSWPQYTYQTKSVLRFLTPNNKVTSYSPKLWQGKILPSQKSLMHWLYVEEVWNLPVFLPENDFPLPQFCAIQQHF